MFPTQNTKRRSRNRIVLVVVLVLVIEPRHPIEDEDENEDDEEKFARRAKILRDSSTKLKLEEPITGPFPPLSASGVLPRLICPSRPKPSGGIAVDVFRDN